MLRREERRAVVICIYKGKAATDAYLVQHWLEANDIRAWIRGESLLSLRGEIPIGEAWPSVWVHSDDRDRAEAAVRLFDSPRLVHPPWRCPRCDEENDPVFGSCWSCGGDGPAVS